MCSIHPHNKSLNNQKKIKGVQVQEPEYFHMLDKIKFDIALYIQRGWVIATDNQDQ
jgi:hypothetical protein